MIYAFTNKTIMGEDMLTFAVCDDNPQFAQALSKRIKSFCNQKLPERIEYTMLPTFGSGLDVLHCLQFTSINVLFLDIDMPGMNGFKLAERLCKTYPDIIIIFVSAYEDFVYSSFDYSPFRFLRKSHLEQELEPTLQKVINKLVLDNETMSFITTDGEQLIRIKDITFFEGDKNYFLINTTSNRTYRCRGTMEDVDKRIQNYDFFRVHAAFIVNEEQIESYSNEGFIKMKNGKRINITKRRLPEFKKSYMLFLRKRITK